MSSPVSPEGKSPPKDPADEELFDPNSWGAEPTEEAVNAVGLGTMPVNRVPDFSSLGLSADPSAEPKPEGKGESNPPPPDRPRSQNPARALLATAGANVAPTPANNPSERPVPPPLPKRQRDHRAAQLPAPKAEPTPEPPRADSSAHTVETVKPPAPPAEPKPEAAPARAEVTPVAEAVTPPAPPAEPKPEAAPARAEATPIAQTVTPPAEPKPEAAPARAEVAPPAVSEVKSDAPMVVPAAPIRRHHAIPAHAANLPGLPMYDSPEPDRFEDLFQATHRQITPEIIERRQRARRYVLWIMGGMLGILSLAAVIHLWRQAARHRRDALQSDNTAVKLEPVQAAPVVRPSFAPPPVVPVPVIEPAAEPAASAAAAPAPKAHARPQPRRVRAVPPPAPALPTESTPAAKFGAVP